MSTGRIIFYSAFYGLLAAFVWFVLDTLVMAWFGIAGPGVTTNRYVVLAFGVFIGYSTSRIHAK